MAVPVIFLGCADPSKTLRLTTEFNAIKAPFAGPIKKGSCELEFEYNLNTGTLFQQFTRSRITDRIAVFHFSGHAGSFGLLLDDMAVQRSALNSFLKEYSSLRLVFLNGCATKEQAVELANDGPAVVGTIRDVIDPLAIQFADYFYQLLANDNDLDTAFRRAQSSLTLGNPQVVAGGFPFELYATDDQKKWKLSDEMDNPYFGLPLPARSFLPPDPYISIRPYTEKEWPVFWGRGKDIRDLYLAMLDETRNPLMLLYGQSGVGKSSLLDAGLVPRLKMRTTVFYARRLPDMGLSKTFFTFLNIPVQVPLNVIKLFTSLYEARKAPVIFIMDQVEEVFTKPLKGDRNELIDFLQLLGKVLAANLPFIKIILGYRKEFHAEIEAEVRHAALPFTTYFLQPLNYDNLKEIITGSQSTNALRQHYRIEMESELENKIATEMSSDTDSPVAPMVQILLTKMWERVRDNDDSRKFTHNLYQELKEQGIALADFVNEKIDEIAKVYPTEVRSGLILDLLYFHTTSLSTAATHDRKDILSRYGNREIINALVEKCKELYLLTDTRVAGQVSLTHDILAPIIRSLFDNSLLPGQKANRLLINQEPYLKNINDIHPLNQRDLLTLKDGKEGMRAWDEGERELVRISEKEIVRRGRTRKILIGFFALAVLAIIVTGIALLFTARSRKLEANRSQALYFNAEARNIMNENPATALHLLRSADSLYPGNINILATLYTLYNQRDEEPVCYRDFYSPFTSPGIEISPDQQSIILYNAEEYTRNKTSATIADFNGRPTGTIRYKNGSIVKMQFLANSKRIMTLLENSHAADSAIESYIIITDLKGQVLDSHVYKHEVYDFIIRENSDTYITLELEKPLNSTALFSYATTINVRTLNSSKIILSHTFDYPKLEGYATSLDKSFFVFASFRSLTILNLNDGTEKKIVSKYGDNVIISPNNKWILTYSNYNGGMLYDANGNFIDSVSGNEGIEFADFCPTKPFVVYTTNKFSQYCIWAFTEKNKKWVNLDGIHKKVFVDSSLNIIAVSGIGLGVLVKPRFKKQFMVENNNIIKNIFAFKNNSLFAISSENHLRLWKFSGTNEIPQVDNFLNINGVKIWNNGLSVFANQTLGEGMDGWICPYLTGVAFVKDTSVWDSNGLLKKLSSIYFVDSLRSKKILENAPYSIGHIFTSPKGVIGLILDDGSLRVIDSSGKNKWPENIRKRRQKWDDINSAAYSQTGDTIFAVTNNGQIFMYNDRGDTINQLAFAAIDSSRSLVNNGRTQMAVCPRSLKIAILLQNKILIVYDLRKSTKQIVELKGYANYKLSPNGIIENGSYVLLENGREIQILDMQKLSAINIYNHRGENLGIDGDTAFIFADEYGKTRSYPLPITLRKWLHTVDIGQLPEDYYKLYYSKVKVLN